MPSPARCKITETTYRGPITWLICLFTGLWCILFCPVDTVLTTNMNKSEQEMTKLDMTKLERRMSGSDMLRV